MSNEDDLRLFIATRIITARKKLGLTIEEAALKTVPPIKPSTWGNYEVATRGIGIFKLISIAKSLKTTLHYLIGESDDIGGELAGFSVIGTGAGKLAIHSGEFCKLGLRESDLLTTKAKDATINHIAVGDDIVIDTSKKIAAEHGLYLLKSGNNQQWLRYIRPEISGDFTLYCDDKTSYPDMTMTPKELFKLEIIGKYVGHLHWEK
jgi:hypothetical protein